MKRIVIFLLTILLTISSTWAAWGDVRLRNITIANGLASNTVRNIIEDKQGFIWFGTDNGLCRHDGLSTIIFNIPELGLDQYISALACYDNGIIVGTGHGVFLLNLQTEQFSKIIGDLNVLVNGIAIDKDYNAWISSVSQGVYKYSLKNGQQKHYDIKEAENKTSAIFVDNNNMQWVLTAGGNHYIYRLNKAKDTFIKASDADNIFAYSMMQTKDNTILIGTWENGLMRLNADGSCTQIINPTTTGVGYHIHSMFEYGQGKVFLGCDDGVIEVNIHDGKWKKLSGDMLNSDRFVYSIIRDNEGGVWYGTFYNGVNYISPVSERFDSYCANDKKGLSGSIVSSFCEGHNGRIWIATDDGGLNCYDTKNKAITNFAGKESLKKKNIHALLEDGDELWIGTYAEGVSRMNIKSGSLKKYRSSKGISESSCYALYKDKKGQIWVGTMDGVSIYNKSDDAFHFIKDFKAVVIDIEEDKQGYIWFATQGSGIWRYQPSNKTWKNYKQEEKDNSLPNNQVNSICVDNNDELWVATSSGLCRYDRANDCFILKKLEIPSNDICCVISDDEALWLSTTNGLIKYVTDSVMQVFNGFDGLPSEQFRNNAGLKDSDGRLYFGSVNGFCAFYPYQIQTNSHIPSVYITSIELYNKPIKVGDERLQLSPSSTDKLELSYKDDMLGITFASLSYCSPEKNQYAYMLEGFDKDWINSGSVNHATYTNIPSGTYTFKVKATNNDGVWSTKEAKLKIVVHPPFWWSWPAKILYALIAALGVYLYTHLKLKRADSKHLREIKRINDARESEEKEARLRFFTMVAHEIRTPVSLIIGPLESVMTKIKGTESDKLVNKDLNIIDRNANRLLDLVNQLLDFNKVQHKGLSIRLSVQNISKIMRAVAERFEPTLKQRNATLTVNYPPADFTATVDGEGLTKIISNLMSNANKYTKDKVVMSCIISGDNFSISVEDNGTGISKEEQEKIFNDFYQAKDNKPGTGIGLSIVKSLVEQHHGTVSLQSQEGKGSIFTITMPIKQDIPVGDTIEESIEKEEETAINTETITEDEDIQIGDSVLIVEDDEDMRNFLAGNFTTTYTVYTAENGKDALEELKKHAVTLIVSDWMMPEMDGAELCKQVRTNPETSHIPFVLLTAKTDDESKAQGMDCGADAYIEKPFSMKYLEACIRNMIEMRRLLMSKFSTHSEVPISSIAKSEVDDNLLTKMNKIIEDNINNPQLSVGFLAEEMGISRSGLFAKIKSLTDITPNEMIQVVRLKKAAKLLTEENYRVNEVCYMVGFSSPSYFTKCFQKQFGMKPAEFIASNR